MAYGVDTTLLKADELSTAWLEELDGDPAVGDDFDLLVELCLSKLSLPRSSSTAVSKSIVHLQGRRIDVQTAKKEAWRLAGNVDRLRVTSPVPPWNGQRFDEWCPVQVRSSEVDTESKKPAFRFVATVMGGTLTGERVRFVWTRKYCSFVASQTLGFARRLAPNRTMFESDKQFVLLRFLALFTQEECRDGRPGFRNIRASSAVQDHNREILRLRRRDALDTRCPYGFPLTTACHRCGVGYDRCQAGTQPTTLEIVLPKLAAAEKR